MMASLKTLPTHFNQILISRYTSVREFYKFITLLENKVYNVIGM